MREETEFRPKPMVDLGGRPILWHIMRRYAAYGLRDFVLCLGYRGEIIKDYFLRYHALGADFTVDLAAGAVECHRQVAEDWRVTLVDTGLDTMTGARVQRVRRYLADDDLFCVTYGDGLADIEIDALVAFHRRHGRLGTVTGVYPPSRFGQLVSDGEQRVDRFSEKPAREGTRISGGFFVFSRAFLDRLPDRADLILEREPLEELARDGELMVYEHDGYWQCADTVRDVDALRALWTAGAAPWAPGPVAIRPAA
ncbi:MAG: glucose-phosphate cytidylyltransferase [Gaiellaceae bacterium]|nr:glucose-phosphate cytidylyltransferase [Gaiellaceae bacterium]